MQSALQCCKVMQLAKLCSHGIATHGTIDLEHAWNGQVCDSHAWNVGTHAINMHYSPAKTCPIQSTTLKGTHIRSVLIKSHINYQGNTSIAQIFLMVLIIVTSPAVPGLYMYKQRTAQEI